MARIKRYSVRVRANDPVSFKKAVGQRLYLDGMRMPTSSRTKVNTPVEVLLSYEDGREALRGTGSVSSCADNEVILKLSWKKDGPGLHEYLFSSSKKYLEPPKKQLKPPPRANAQTMRPSFPSARVEASEFQSPMDSSDCTLMVNIVAGENQQTLAVVDDNNDLTTATNAESAPMSDQWEVDQSADDLASLVWDYGDDSPPLSSLNALQEPEPAPALGVGDDLLGAFEEAQADLQSLELAFNSAPSEQELALNPASSQSITHVRVDQLESYITDDDLIPLSQVQQVESLGPFQPEPSPEDSSSVLNSPTLTFDADEVTAEHALVSEQLEVIQEPVVTDGYRFGGAIAQTVVSPSHFGEDMAADNTERLTSVPRTNPSTKLPNPADPPKLGVPEGPLLAIDLGTSHTCATLATGDSVSPVRFANQDEPGMPSVVVVDPAGRLLVGDKGVQYIDKHPDGVVVGVKRLVGRSYWSPAIRRVRDQLGWKVEPAADGSVTAHVGREVTSLEALTGALYRQVTEQAVNHSGRPINRAMLSCPVYFGHRQRSALAQAGRLAGLHVERIVSSNLAILAYYYNGYAPALERVLVIDMGAGTFEVAMAEVEGNRFSTLVSGGHPFLGGIEFDACVAQLVVAALDRRGSAPKLTRSALAGMLRVAERGKRAFAQQSEVELQLDTRVHIGSSPMKVNLFRQEAEGLWDGLMDKALGIIRDVCRRASMRHEDVDRILLVGGQTCAPYVRRRLRSFFRRDMCVIDDPRAIASGTAVIARANDNGRPLNLEETLPASLRLVSSSGHVLASVKRDVPLPMENECLVRLPSSERTILVYEGDHNNLQSCEPLGRVVFDDMPPDSELNVRLQVDSDTGLRTQVRQRGSNIEIPSRFEAVVTSEDFLIPVAVTPHTGDLDGGFLQWLGRKLPNLTST